MTVFQPLKIWCCLLGAWLLISPPALADPQAPSIHFVCGPPPYQSNFKLAQRFLGQVFQRLGYEYVQQHMNTEQAIELLRTGEADGDCGRLNGFTKQAGLDNLVSLRPSYGFASVSYWYVQEPNKPRTELLTGYNADGLMLKTLLHHMGYQRLKPIRGSREQIRQLLKGEIDLLFNFDQALKHLPLASFEPRIYQSDSVLSLPIRPLIHKRHQKLADDWQRVAQTVLADNQKRAPTKGRDAKVDIIFGCSVPEDDRIFTELLPIYSEAFKRLNLTFKMISLPRARESHELSIGHLDGTCARTLAFEQHPSHSLRVDAPLIQTKLRVWSLNPHREITSIDDFSSNDRLAMVRGTAYLQEKLEYFEGGIEELPNMLTGLKMLASGRIDYLIGFEVAYMTSLGASLIDIPVYSIGKLGTVDIYPFLQRQHRALLKPLRSTLRQIMTEQERPDMPERLAPFR